MTGTGFIPGLSVTVGGVACADVAVASSTSLTCTTPAGSAGAVAVAVTNLGQPAASLAGGSLSCRHNPGEQLRHQAKETAEGRHDKDHEAKVRNHHGVPRSGRRRRHELRGAMSATTESSRRSPARTSGHMATTNLTLTWKSKATTTATAYESSKLYRNSLAAPLSADVQAPPHIPTHAQTPSYWG